MSALNISCIKLIFLSWVFASFPSFSEFSFPFFSLRTYGPRPDRANQHKTLFLNLYSVINCCCSVAKLCLPLCDPTDCSMQGFPVLHHLPEFVQTQVHWVSNTTELFHPLSPSSPALNLSQHQGLFQWVGSSHQVVRVSDLNPYSCQSHILFILSIHTDNWKSKLFRNTKAINNSKVFNNVTSQIYFQN